MKRLATARLVVALILSLAMSPILSYSSAHAAVMGEASQQQIDNIKPDNCHQVSTDQKCQHCSSQADSSCCQHHTDGKCDSSCGHVVVSAVMNVELFHASHNHQTNLATLKQYALNVDPEAWLRPPQLT